MFRRKELSNRYVTYRKWSLLCHWNLWQEVTTTLLIGSGLGNQPRFIHTIHFLEIKGREEEKPIEKINLSSKVCTCNMEIRFRWPYFWNGVKERNILRNREEFIVERGAKVEPGVLLMVFDIPNLICTHALSTVISVCGLRRTDFYHQWTGEYSFISNCI